MEDTWAWRDLPVLDAVVILLDESAGTGTVPDVADIGERVESGGQARLGDLEVAAALESLAGDYLDLRKTAGDLSSWYVASVTSAARREVGQWPTGESLVERLAAGLAEAAEREPDPERKKTLRAVARELGGAVKAVAVNVASEILEHRLPH
jgi:hypothetical protein